MMEAGENLRDAGGNPSQMLQQLGQATDAWEANPARRRRLSGPELWLHRNDGGGEPLALEDTSPIDSLMPK
jgi:hypothetical protein